MNTKRPKTDEFLQAMNLEPPPASETPPPVTPAAPPTKSVKAKPTTRAGLTHIGGYLDRETVEKVAVLRVRLGLDKSALIKLAIDELHRKQMAKRSFGDA